MGARTIINADCQLDWGLCLEGFEGDFQAGVTVGDGVTVWRAGVAAAELRACLPDAVRVGFGLRRVSGM